MATNFNYYLRDVSNSLQDPGLKRWKRQHFRQAFQTALYSLSNLAPKSLSRMIWVRIRRHVNLTETEKYGNDGMPDPNGTECYKNIFIKEPPAKPTNNDHRIKTSEWQFTRLILLLYVEDTTGNPIRTNRFMEMFNDWEKLKVDETRFFPINTSSNTNTVDYIYYDNALDWVSFTGQPADLATTVGDYCCGYAALVPVLYEFSGTEPAGSDKDVYDPTTADHDDLHIPSIASYSAAVKNYMMGYLLSIDRAGGSMAKADGFFRHYYAAISAQQQADAWLKYQRNPNINIDLANINSQGSGNANVVR